MQEWHVNATKEREPTFNAIQVQGDRSMHTLDESHLQDSFIQEKEIEPDDPLYNIPIEEVSNLFGDWLEEPSSKYVTKILYYNPLILFYIACHQTTPMETTWMLTSLHLLMIM